MKHRDTVRTALLSAMPGLVADLPEGDQIVVTLPLLRQAARNPELLAQPGEPFRWKPAFVRRSLGLAAMGACLDHRFSTPGEAVGPVMEEALAEWLRTGWRTFHWEPWLAALSFPARAVVVAQAVTWATTLWSVIDRELLDRPLQLGGADDQWVCRAARTVRLRGRSELRIPLDASHGGTRARATVLVTVAAGLPLGAWETELAFPALVAALRPPSRPVPARVVGLWPESGQFRSVDITAELLCAAGDRAISCIAAVVNARRSAAGPSAAGPSMVMRR